MVGGVAVIYGCSFKYEQINENNEILSAVHEWRRVNTSTNVNVFEDVDGLLYVGVVLASTKPEPRRGITALSGCIPLTKKGIADSYKNRKSAATLTWHRFLRFLFGRKPLYEVHRPILYLIAYAQ